MKFEVGKAYKLIQPWHFYKKANGEFFNEVGLEVGTILVFIEALGDYWVKFVCPVGIVEAQVGNTDSDLYEKIEC